MYKRIVLKLSGETLAPSDNELQALMLSRMIENRNDLLTGEETSLLKGIEAKIFGKTEAESIKSYSFTASRLEDVASALADVHATGVQLGIVMGGGNIWRGRFTDTMNPVNADNMGMLATIINAICVHDALAQLGVPSTVFTAQEMPKFSEVYTAERAVDAMNSGRIVLLAGGTGNPFFTTDTGAALRAAELGADALFKGTNVEGVYDKDPNKYPDAVLCKELSYKECIDRGIGVMDTTAFEICRKQNIKMIRIFNMDNLQNIVDVVKGDDRGSVIHA